MSKPKTTDEIAVHCQHSKLVDIRELKPNPKNPNCHGEAQIALLAKNIRALGWRHPVIVSLRSGLVVAGHARIEAAQLMNINRVPVDYQPFASEADETAYLISDNRIAELAERDGAVLADLLAELDDGTTDRELTGYTEAAIAELIAASKGVEGVEGVEGEETVEKNDPRILVRLSFNPAVWLGARNKIMQIVGTLESRYECKTVVDE